MFMTDSKAVRLVSLFSPLSTSRFPCFIILDSNTEVLHSYTMNSVLWCGVLQWISLYCKSVVSVRNEICVICASSQSSWKFIPFEFERLFKSLNTVEWTQTLTLYSDIFVAQKRIRNTENFDKKLCFVVETNALCLASLDW